MATNDITLRAVLDTQNIEKALQSITGKSANTAIVGDIVNRDAMRRFNEFESSFRGLEGDLSRQRGASIFGDTKGIQQTNAALKILQGTQQENIAQIVRMKETYTQAFEQAKRAMLTVRQLGKGAQAVFNSKGAAGLQNLRDKNVPGFVATKAGDDRVGEYLNAIKVQQAYQKEGILGLEKGLGAKDAAFENAHVRGAIAAKTHFVGLDGIHRQYNKIGKTVGEFATKAKTAMKPLLTMLHNLGIEGNSLLQVFGKLIGKVTTWLLATVIIFSTIRAVKALVREMKALQDAETGLRKILNGNKEAVDKNVKSAFAFAKVMNMVAGAVFKDTISALKDAKKAGFDFNDALLITKSSLLAVNIAELTVEQSTRYLVATIRQFNLTAFDSLWILNQWNELSQETGATTQGIAEAVVRSGKAFQSVGGTLSQLNAIAATTIEQTGESGEKIGTMLKTLSARFADLDKRNSFADLLSTKGIDIDVYDELTGEFNGIFNVLFKLSKIWEKLDGRLQSNIAKSAAGIRQYSRFLGVVKNFDSIIRGLAISIDSASSSITENQQRVHTLDFALRQLNGSMSTLARSEGGMGALKAMTVAVNALTVVLNFLASSMGRVTLILTTLIVIILKIPAMLVGLGNILAGFVIEASLVGLGAAIGGLLTPIGWVIAALGVFTAILTFLGVTSAKVKQQMIAMNSVIEEEAVALFNSRTELQKNEKMFREYYKTLNKTTDEGKAQAKVIEDMFKNVGAGEITKSIKNINSLSNIMKSVTEGFEKASKSTEGFDAAIIDAFKGINLSKGINLFNKSEISEFDTRLQKLKKTIHETEKAKGEEGFLYTHGITLATFKRYINVFDAALKKQRQNDIDATIRDANLNEQLINKQNNRLLKLVQQYYKKQYDEDKKAYDKKKKLNENMVKGFTAGVLDLTEGITGAERLEKAFSGIGETLFNQMTSDLNESIVKSLTGKGPEDLAKKMRDAISAGGEDAKEQLINGFTQGSKTMVDALQKWEDRLSDRLFGQTASKEVKDILTAAGIFTPSSTNKNNLNIRNKYKDGDIYPIGFKFNKHITSRKMTEQFGENTEGIGAVEAAASSSDELIAFYSNQGVFEAMQLQGDAISNSTEVQNKYTHALINGSEAIAKFISGAIGGFADFLTKKSGGLGLPEELVEGAFTGGGVGAYVAGTSGKDAGSGGGLGALLGAGLGMTPLGPAGMLLGGLLGGLFAAPKADEDKKEDENIQYAKESIKELRQVNRNLTIMIEDIKPWNVLNESYYFSVSNNRGLN